MPIAPPKTSSDERWRSVLARDKAADGIFYYAVATTGVYCRPGCASRLPHRRNVAFYENAEAAQQAGYRPCKRCRPNEIAPQRLQTDAVAQACRTLDQDGRTPGLHELAAEAGLSPGHFHRVFRHTLGVTPRQYAAARRMARFRAGLQTGSPVTEAIYEAGFGSSGRAYAAATDHLGMSPSAYRSGAAGVSIRYAAGPCLLGWVAIAATDRGICAIELGDDPAALRDHLRQRFPEATLSHGDAPLAAMVREVGAAIETPQAGLDLPLDIQGTTFQQRVWNALCAIPAGETVSYGELASRLGNVKAARAVAAACAANALAIAVPCHRAVRADGTPGGYRWGVERKRALLVREGGAASAK